MSLSYVIDVHCDRCGAWCPGSVGKQPRRTEAVQAARRSGWVRSMRGKYLDLCPKCVKAEGRLKEKKT